MRTGRGRSLTETVWYKAEVTGISYRGTPCFLSAFTPSCFKSDLRHGEINRTVTTSYFT